MMEFTQHNPGNIFPEDDSELDAFIASSTESMGTPADLLSRIERRIRTRARKRMYLSSAGLVAAAMIAIYSVIYFLPAATIPSGIERRIAEEELPTINEKATQVARVRFDHDSNVIAIKHETDDPTVSIVWVYQPAKAPEDDDTNDSDISEEINLQG